MQRKYLKEVPDRNGVNIGMNTNNLRCGDDTALVALNTANLQALLNEVDTFGKPYGMEMNVGKIKCIVVSEMEHKIVDLQLDGAPVEQISKFIFLGYMAMKMAEVVQK